MKLIGGFLFSLVLLAGCAGTRQNTLVDCDRESSLALGLKDGASGRKANFSFLSSCSAESRSGASLAYREGFESSRPRRKVGKEETSALSETLAEDLKEGTSLEKDSVTTATVPVAPPVSWVCEVEANSKVFTGVGITRDEALGSARSNCGSHFQASYCEKADCKQSL